MKPASTWAAALVMVAVIGVFGLEANGSGDQQNLMVMLTAFATPTIMLMLKADEASKKVEEGNRKLDGISHALNGEFDSRVRSIVREELDELRQAIEDLKEAIK